MAKHKIIFKKERELELGFGGSVAGQRQMNKDGSSNIVRKGVHHFSPLNTYYTLVTISWKKFNLIIFIAYLAVNLIFACVYYFFIGIEQLGGVYAESEFQRFMEAFFFQCPNDYDCRLWENQPFRNFCKCSGST